MVSKEVDDLMVLIISQLPEKPICSSNDKAVTQEVVNEEHAIKVPHIDLFHPQGSTIDIKRL